MSRTKPQVDESFARLVGATGVFFGALATAGLNALGVSPWLYVTGSGLWAAWRFWREVTDA